MVLGYIKPVSGTVRLRYARPGYDANDLTLPQNQVAFDSQNAGMFSIIAKGLWQGDLTTMTGSKVQIVSWPTLSYIPICTFSMSIAVGSYSNTINYGYYIAQVLSGQSAVGNNGLDVSYDGIYWKFGGTAGSLVNPNHVSLWWVAHRMKAI